MTPIETIAAVRQDGRQRDCACPAHDDRRASLSVGLGTDRRLLLHCHAGCALDAILAALGLRARDLFGKSRGHDKPNKKPGKIVATYPYHDEHGTHLYDVVRFAPKAFKQRRADGVWSINGVRRVLFGLPEIQGQAVVYIVEGEKDVLTLRTLGITATTNPGGASKGKSKWRPEYGDQLVHAGVQHVVILPDNDEPGRMHAGYVAEQCHAAHLIVKVVDLPNLPAAGDVSDWIAAGHTPAELIALAQAAPRYPPPPEPTAPHTLAEVEEIFRTWIRDPDPIPTRAVLASYVANRKLDGDPVWIMLVGGSGVGKTERLIPLAVMPDVVLESAITGPAALLSGTGKKERAKDATGGLLRKLPASGGVLLLKDFTSIIDMHRDARAEVLAALREIYDGRWDRSVGAEGGRTLSWTGHLGLVAGCTTAIDSAHSVMSVMGTRFMLVRLQGDPDIAGSAFDHVGQERVMRDALRAGVRGLLDHLLGAPYDKTEVKDRMIALAKYVARARSPVDRDHQGEIRLVLDAEAPTRVVKMLAQLWRASGLLGLSKPDAWAMVQRVGLDSIPKLRRSILDCLATPLNRPQSTTDIGESVGHPTRTTRRGLEDLAAHGVIQKLGGGQGKADLWMLTKQAREWLDLLTLPVSSGSPHTPSTPPARETPSREVSIETQITNDDKTGKVRDREEADGAARRF